MIRTRKRFQKGSLSKRGKRWVGQWWEAGHRRKRTLGQVSEMTKSRTAESIKPTFSEFVEHTYLPFYRGKWKRSTAMTNEQRIEIYLISVFAARALDSFSRDELQEFLKQKAAASLSYSIVAHLRWGLRQIFRMAVEERHLDRNPAELLFVPREAKRPEHPVMTKEEVNRLLMGSTSASA